MASIMAAWSGSPFFFGAAFFSSANAGAPKSPITRHASNRLRFMCPSLSEVAVPEQMNRVKPENSGDRAARVDGPDGLDATRAHTHQPVVQVHGRIAVARNQAQLITEF